MDRVKCRACGGTGSVGLSPAMSTAYRLLRDGGPSTPTTVAGIYRNLGLGPHAWANRFARLERMGLATSERRGRERIYTASGATTCQPKPETGSDSPTTPGNFGTTGTG